MRSTIRAAAVAAVLAVLALVTACAGGIPEPLPSSTPSVTSHRLEVHAFLETTGKNSADKAALAVASVLLAKQVTDFHPDYVKCEDDPSRMYWTERVWPLIDANA